MSSEKFHYSLSCPLPQLDFDRIVLGHGSGGLLSKRLIDKVIRPALGDTIVSEWHDGALLNTTGKLAFSSDSYVVSPIFFPGGNIGDLAIHGTVNDLAMCGAVAKSLSLSFILEEGLPIADFWEILLSIKAACERSNVKIVTGDTKVVDRKKCDQIFISTSGIGDVHPQADVHAKNIRAGDKIIVSGNIASHGIAVMSVRQGLEFETQVISDTAPLHSAVNKLLDAFGNKIHFLRDPTRGGVATVLNEAALDAKLSMEIFEKDIPVLNEVNGACELLGLDPLHVANEGIFIAIVDSSIADDAVKVLKADPLCSDATFIGEVMSRNPPQLICHSSIGGKRVVPMLLGEQLPRIC